MVPKRTHAHQQTHRVESFNELVLSPFHEQRNAIGWPRDLKGNFKEIVDGLESDDHMFSISEKDLERLSLSKDGNLARETILEDIRSLKSIGAQPTLNLIKHYERDFTIPFFPTDVYSFHVDHSPIPTATYLCTYHGAESEILPNEQAQQKILIPEIRAELLQLHNGPEEGFAQFLKEHFFDLHYQAKPKAQPYSLGQGNLWKLAVDHPNSPCLPCIHRAPTENHGESRLLLIC